MWFPSGCSPVAVLAGSSDTVGTYRVGGSKPLLAPCISLPIILPKVGVPELVSSIGSSTRQSRSSMAAGGTELCGQKSCRLPSGTSPDNVNRCLVRNWSVPLLGHFILRCWCVSLPMPNGNGSLISQTSSGINSWFPMMKIWAVDGSCIRSSATNISRPCWVVECQVHLGLGQWHWLHRCTKNSAPKASTGRPAHITRIYKGIAMYSFMIIL